MLSDQEKRELAVLRGRAYGRGDVIRGSELARLRELEALAAGRSGREATGAPSGAAGDAIGPGIDTTHSVDGPADGSVGGSEQSPEATRRSPRRHRRGVLLTIAVGVVGIALGAGIATVAVSRPEPTVVATTRDTELSPAAAEQLPAVAEMGTWDTGSLHVLGGLDATTIWSATREAGEETCVIVYSAAEDQGLTVTCADTATVTADGVTGVVSVYDVGGSSAVFGFRANPALDPGVVFRRQ
jgi:hypothetical protein